MEFELGPWNAIMGTRNVNRGPCNVIMGPWNVNRGPCNVIMEPRNLIMDRGMLLWDRVV